MCYAETIDLFQYCALEECQYVLGLVQLIKQFLRYNFWSQNSILMLVPVH